MTQRVVCLQHDRVDGPGLIADWARSRGHDLRVVGPDDSLPEPSDQLDLLILLGGSASALDRTPRQLGERSLARAMVEKGTPVLGLCLGAQMLALEFGGDVVPGGAPEHDWSTIDAKDTWLRDMLGDEHPVVFQAHNDAIRLPLGAIPLASSPNCEIEAFSGPGAVLGLQFHLEADAEKVEAFRRLRGYTAGYAGDEERLAQCRHSLYRLLDDFLVHRRNLGLSR